MDSWTIANKASEPTQSPPRSKEMTIAHPAISFINSAMILKCARMDCAKYGVSGNEDPPTVARCYSRELSVQQSRQIRWFSEILATPNHHSCSGSGTRSLQASHGQIWLNDSKYQSYLGSTNRTNSSCLHVYSTITTFLNNDIRLDSSCAVMAHTLANVTLLAFIDQL